MLRIAVLVSGGGTNLQALIDACQAGTINGEIVLVVSNRKKAYGLERAQKAGIKNCVIKDQAKLLECLQAEKIDLVVLAGYLAIISDEMLAAYRNRIINIHPSLLPAFCGPGYYGLHVHEAAFKRGVKISGATVHFVSEVVDGGPIILQEAMDVSQANSPEEMQQMILEIEHHILPEAVRLFCSGCLQVEEERVKIQ